MTFVIVQSDQSLRCDQPVQIERKRGACGEVLAVFVFPAWDILSESKCVEKPYSIPKMGFRRGISRNLQKTSEPEETSTKSAERSHQGGVFLSGLSVQSGNSAVGIGVFGWFFGQVLVPREVNCHS
jgi:hypothetical protein